ncbi:hypothetical protein MJD09_26140, partial [bacterium]|nr:hypothetical protein [bacterium]
MDFKFRVGERVQAFLENITSPEIRVAEVILYLVGWLFSLGVLLFYATSGVGSYLFTGLFCFFWFKLVGIIDAKLRPPNELLLLVLFLISFGETTLLQALYPAVRSLAFPEQALQFAILSVQILLFSLILVRNSQGKRGVLFVYLILAVIGMIVLKSPRLFYLFVFQLVLFIFLLRKTSWLEELTKLECWAYVLLALGGLRYLLDVD